MKHILIIVYEMVPYSSTWGGCQRMFFLAEQMVSDGYQVSVVCHKSSIMNYHGVIPKFHLVPIDDNGNICEIEKAEDIVGKTVGQPTGLGRMKSFIKGNAIVKRLGLSYLRFQYNNPSPVLGKLAWEWSGKALHKVSEIIKDNKVNNVIVSAPPFGTFRFAVELRKLFGSSLNIITDYRDPWNLWKNGGLPARNKEKAVLFSSSCITVTTDAMKQGLIKKFHIPAENVFILANGYSKAVWDLTKDIAPDDKTITFMYIGTISIEKPVQFRNPSNIIAAFKKVMIENDQIRLLFIGAKDAKSETAKNIEQETNERISFISSVSQEKSLEYMKQASVLVQIHTPDDNSGKYLISGKVYDYLRSGKPILSIGRNGDATQLLIQDLNIGITVEDNTDEIISAILKFIDIEYCNQLLMMREKTSIEHFSREYQNECFVKAIIKQEK